MLKIERTNTQDPDFVGLVTQLDRYLAEIDGAEHDFYATFNKINLLDHIVIAYLDGEPVACGAIKKSGADSMEVKRMFTLPVMRGKGLARMVLAELEQISSDEGCRKLVLETGKRMPDAIALYERNGFVRVPNFGPYIGVDNSVCFEKLL